jgi:hypothetical protein
VVGLVVRLILLAERLVGVFRRCLEGAEGNEVDQLASSFLLASCERREPVVELLRQACMAPAGA